MATKIFQKFFENFKGLDLSSSALTRPLNFASIFKNFEIKRPFSLQSRKGFKYITQDYLSTGSTDEEVLYPTAGIFDYIYSVFDPATNTIVTNEELIGVGYGLYKLQTGTLSITYTGAGTARFSFVPTTSGWIANLTVDGASQTGFPFNCFSGIAGNPTLEDLRVLINAVVNFTAVLTPWAMVNGNQVGVGRLNTPITVDAGHTITVSTTLPKRIEVEDRSGGLPLLRFCRDVTAVTATTVTLRQPEGGATIDVNDGDILGVGLYQAAILPIVPPTSAESLLSSTAQTYSFNYWERIEFPSIIGLGVQGRFGAGFANRPNPDSTPCSFVNKDNVAFVAGPLVSINNQYIALNDFRYSLRPYSALLKYDGMEFYGADLPPGRMTAVIAAGGTLTVATYKYLITFQHIDARGNINESADNRSSYDGLKDPLLNPDPVRFQNISVTTTAGNQQVTLGIPQVQSNSLGEDYYRNYLQAIASNGGTQVYATGAIVFTVGAAPSLRVGNIATWTNATDGKIQRGPVTAVTNTTLTITTDRAGSIANGSYFSNNLTKRVYRTKAGGNLFYLLLERPNIPIPGASDVVVDNAADSTLTELYDDPGEFVRDNPPAVRQITTHQGLLVGWSDPQAPQSIYWSNVNENECWTIGRNEVNLGDLSLDPLRVCASDTETMLAAFTDRGYFNISGDLSEALFSIDAVGESDVGCTTPQSLRKIRDFLFYLSPKGYRALRAGKFINLEDRLVSVYQNNFYQQITNQPITDAQQSKLYALRGHSCVDTENQRYVSYVPAESSFNGTGGVTTVTPNGFGRVFVYDYAKDCWIEWDLQGGVGGGISTRNMSGGTAIHKNRFYFNAVAYGASVEQNLGRLFALNNSETNYDYMDNTSTIPRTIRPQWDAMDEPSVDAVYQDIKLYMLDNDENIAGVNFRVRTYRNYNSAFASLDSDLTLSFAVGQTEATKRLKLNKSRAIEFEFYNDEAYVNPVITGYEYVVAVPYKKDSLILK